MIQRLGRLGAIGVVLLSMATMAQAAVKLPSVIGDNMVLQREQPIPIWGWDTAGTQVKVTLGEASATATAGQDGKWMVKLPALKADGKTYELQVAGTTNVTVKNIVVGEVWLCSGQSNMEWSVKQSLNPAEEVAASANPLIRHIKVPHVPAATPQDDVMTGGWKLAAPETTGDFTAVGYYFARHVHNELKVPVGLLGSNWGGTRIEPWTPPVGFKSVPELAEIGDNLDKFPQKNANGAINHQSALALYNGMIHPLVPYGIRGALWYQGESNNGEGMKYFDKKKALITGWRKVWGNDDMPFYFVQLAPFTYGPANGDATRLAKIWEAQTATLSIPNTGMAVTVDISNLKDIHPKNKQDVGKRLALWALAKTYGKTGLVYSGPLYKSSAIEGSKIRVTFDHVGGGLVARDGKPLSFWEVAGEDKKFVAATAEIVGANVVVGATEVAAPKYVRFGFHQLAEPNLSNKEGLPASPFRTDKDE